jgi:PAS domain S-box-containing protein
MRKPRTRGGPVLLDSPKSRPASVNGHPPASPAAPAAQPTLPLTATLKALRSRVVGAFPRGRTLPDEVWERRHRALLTLLWLHALGLTIFARLRGYSVEHSLLHGGTLVVFAILASALKEHHRAAAVSVSLGLITSSALLVHSWGGVIEGHFHFFVVIALLALYEDWLPLLVAAAYVVIHHGVAGALDPHAVYNHPDAVAHPWKWAVIHGGFVLAAGAASVANWRLNEDVRSAMRESETRLEEAQRIAHVGSWEWELASDRVTWSNELYRIFGLDPSSWTPSYDRFVERVHGDDREAVERNIARTLETGEPLRYEARIRRPSGELRTIDCVGGLVAGVVGTPARLVGTAQDVTERRRVERELAAKNANDRAHRERSDFLSRVSHELRTPLNAILGFAQLLELDDLEPSEQKKVQQITKGGRHLLELINEVLEISRIDSGNMKISLEAVSVNRVVDEVLELLQPLAARQSVTFESNLKSDDPAYVMADNQRLKQVLLNLVSNAIKYNREGGSALIRVERPTSDRCLLLVKDSGKGISEKALERIFTPFERLDAAHSNIEGTGLGLALSKLLVDAMGGTLAVESEPWVGSTFIVGLAAASKPSFDLAADLPYEGRAEPASKQVTVLYVEDNISNFELVEQVFSDRPNVSLLAAASGTLGLELAREHSPDLILLDLHLPGMPGEKVLAELKDDPRTHDIPVVVLSSDATEAQIKKLMSAGAHAYLTKPISVRPFLEAVDAVIETRSREAAHV